MILLAKELARRRHTVVFASCGPAVESALRGGGVDWSPGDSAEPGVIQVHRIHNPMDEAVQERHLRVLFDMQRNKLARARANVALIRNFHECMFAALLTAHGCLHFDAFVVDVMTLAGFDAAEACGVPLIVSSTASLGMVLAGAGHETGPYATPHLPAEAPWVALPVAMSRAQALVNPLVKAGLRLGTSLCYPRNRIRATLGLPPLRGAQVRLPTAPGGPVTAVLIATSPALEPPRPRLPPGWHLVGPLLERGNLDVWPPDASAERLRCWMDNAASQGGRVVVVSTGTMVRLTTAHVAGFCAIVTALLHRHPSLRVLWSLLADSHADLPQSFLAAWPGCLDSELAATCRVGIAAWVPQTAALAHPAAAAFWTHAGLNSVHEALAVGCPVIACPFGWDQFANAQHCVACGAGIHLNARAVAKAARSGRLAAGVAGRIAAVCHDGSYAEAAQRVAADISACHGPSGPADRIECALQALN